MGRAMRASGFDVPNKEHLWRGLGSWYPTVLEIRERVDVSSNTSVLRYEEGVTPSIL